MKTQRGKSKGRKGGKQKGTKHGSKYMIEKFKEKYPDITTIIQDYDRKPGSPQHWKKDYCRQIFFLALAGLNEIQMANIIGISSAGFDKWKRTHPDFAEALKAGKIEAVGVASHALFQVGVGFEHEAIKMFPKRVKEYDENGKVIRETTEIIKVPYIKKYPPNVRALEKFLAAKYPEVWGDKSEVVHSGSVTHNIDVTKLSKKQLKYLQKVKELGEKA